MLLKRVISGILVATFIISTEWFSPFIWFLAVCGIAIFSNYELQKLIEEKNYRNSYKLTTSFIFFFLLATYVTANIPVTKESILDNLMLLVVPQNHTISTTDWRNLFSAPIMAVQNLMLGLAFVFSIIVNLNYKPRATISELSFVFMRIIYLGFFPSYIILMRALPNGNSFLLALLFSGAFSDIFAYFVGKKFGKTPFFSEISPNKTMEGSIGGVIACIICYMIFGFYFINIPWYHSFMLGLITAIISPMGDLIESLIKRDVGKKDSGNLIPGHGGILDRVDSYIFSSFPIYFYILWAIY